MIRVLIGSLLLASEVILLAIPTRWLVLNSFGAIVQWLAADVTVRTVAAVRVAILSSVGAPAPIQGALARSCSLWILGRHRPTCLTAGLYVGEEALRHFLNVDGLMRGIGFRRLEAHYILLALPSILSKLPFAHLQYGGRPVSVVDFNDVWLLPACVCALWVVL